MGTRIPISRFKLDSDVADTGSNKVTAVNTGVTFVSGQINNAGSFDGAADFITTPSTGYLTTAGTVTLWISSDNTPGADEFAFGLGTGVDSERLEIKRDSSGDLIVRLGDTTIYSASMADATFIYVALTWDGTDANVFVGGSQVATSIAYTGFSSIVANADIGSFNGGTSGFWDGLIDDVRIYSTELSAADIFKLFTFSTGFNEILINNVDYSDFLLDWFMAKVSTYYGSEFWAEVIDPIGAIETATERYNEIKILQAGTCRFTGLAKDILPEPNDAGLIRIIGVDYWTILNRTPVTRTFSASTRSAVIISIVNTELAGYGLTTTGVVATTVTDDFTFINRPASNIFLQFAIDEGFIVQIDETKDVIYRSNNAVDTGVHLIKANNDIRNEDFPKTGGDVVNVVQVIGAPGRPPNKAPVGAIYENDALINKYKTDDHNGKLPLLEINAPELLTPQECFDRAIFEFMVRNEDPQRGIVSTNLDFDLDFGEIVTLTIPNRNITASTFLIQTVRHQLSTDETEIDVTYYSRQAADLSNVSFESAKKAEAYVRDTALVLTLFKQLVETITITAFVTVERRTFSGAEFGEFDFGAKTFGQLSGVFTTPINNQQISVPNIGIENFLRIIGQLATIPTDYQASNAHIAVGTGTTAIDLTATPTTVEGEFQRNAMNAGYPNTATDKEIEWQVSFDDVDFVVGSINKVALHNSATVGDVSITGVLGSTVTKAADEEIRTTMKLVLAGVLATTAGLNLLRDLYIAVSTAFVDNSNAGMKITFTDVTTYEEAVSASSPEFLNSNNSTLRYEIVVDTTDISSNGLAGKIFTELDLFNMFPTAGGVLVVDGVVSSTTVNALQNLQLQILLELSR